MLAVARGTQCEAGESAGGMYNWRLMSCRKTLPRGGAGLLAILATIATGCSPPAPAEPPKPRLTRLLPDLGPPEFLQLDEDTRPATLLHPGEVRRCKVKAPAGSRLHFSFGIPKDAKSEGWLHLKVRDEGKELYRRKVSALRRDHWWQASRWSRLGPREPRVRGTPVKRDGSAAERKAAATEPWLALASRACIPRVRARPGGSWSGSLRTPSAPTT